MHFPLLVLVPAIVNLIWKGVSLAKLRPGDWPSIVSLVTAAIVIEIMESAAHGSDIPEKLVKAQFRAWAARPGA